MSKILHSLKVNKATGRDKIPARLVRDAEVELAPSLTYLINKSITDGTVPALWKVARVTPLYKSEDKLLVGNCRPISVLPVLSKVLVHTQVSAYLDRLGLLYNLHNGGQAAFLLLLDVCSLDITHHYSWLSKSSYRDSEAFPIAQLWFSA